MERTLPKTGGGYGAQVKGPFDLVDALCYVHSSHDREKHR
jgi:hypothetical protein